MAQENLLVTFLGMIPLNCLPSSVNVVNLEVIRNTFLSIELTQI